MKQYHYFISYQYKKQHENGFGQITLLLNDRVSGSEHIEMLIDHIKEKYNFNSVVIINLILLREEESNNR